MVKRFIFGLGSGRSGTDSLARLLDSQPGFTVSHEITGGPAWQFNHGYLEILLSRLHTKETPVVGDVAYHLLPYVEALLERLHDARFVCLKRDKEKTVASFRDKLTDRGTPWHMGIWKGDCWEGAYITPEVENFEELISIYWENYYAHAQMLQAKYPDRFRIWPLEALNAEDSQREILQFVGVPDDEMVLQVGIRSNTNPLKAAVQQPESGPRAPEQAAMTIPADASDPMAVSREITAPESEMDDAAGFVTDTPDGEADERIETAEVRDADKTGEAASQRNSQTTDLEPDSASGSPGIPMLEGISTIADTRNTHIEEPAPGAIAQQDEKTAQSASRSFDDPPPEFIVVDPNATEFAEHALTAEGDVSPTPSSGTDLEQMVEAALVEEEDTIVERYDETMEFVPGEDNAAQAIYIAGTDTTSSNIAHKLISPVEGIEAASIDPLIMDNDVKPHEKYVIVVRDPYVCCSEYRSHNAEMTLAEAAEQWVRKALNLKVMGAEHQRSIVLTFNELISGSEAVVGKLQKLDDRLKNVHYFALFRKYDPDGGGQKILERLDDLQMSKLTVENVGEINKVLFEARDIVEHFGFAIIDMPILSETEG